LTKLAGIAIHYYQTVMVTFRFGKIELLLVLANTLDACAATTNDNISIALKLI
tara:strand:- start:598 stop:756 length:159 start_codon:yes stop_codon:yes gene_type:complete